MKTKLASLASAPWRALLGAALLTLSIPTAQALPIITNVVETGGDDEATDTVTAKWTGVILNNGVAGEFATDFKVPPFGEEAPAYVDRIHQWNGATPTLPLPSYLVGGEYIMIGNDNRDNTDLKLDVTLSEPALVYVLIDNRLSDGNADNPPDFSAGSMSWIIDNEWKPVLNGLNRTADKAVPDEVGVDEGGDGKGPGVAINNWSSVYVKTFAKGTFSIYQPDNGGRNMYGVVVTALPGSVTAPPQFSSLNPTNNVLFYNPAGGLSITATTVSPNRIDNTNVSLVLNGVSVSASLTFSGDPTKRTATFNGLKADTIYNARVVVSDQAGRSATNSFVFDTLSASTATVVEAEDYNYDGGKSLAAPKAAGYANLAGKPEVDYHDQNATTKAAQYRSSDFAGLTVTTDGPRPGFSTGAADYQIADVVAGDWINFTRTLNNGTYNIYLRASSSVGARVRLDKTGDATTVNQNPFPLGIFAVPPPGLGTPFTYVPLTGISGTPVAITLSGASTFRLTAVGASDPGLLINFLVFVPAGTGASPPFISDFSPAANAVNVAVDAIVKATIVNGSTQVAAGSVALTFNGTNVTAAATISTTADGVAITYDPPGSLPVNSVFPVSLVFKDAAGVSFSQQWSFKSVPFSPIVTKVVETGGDEEATDTVTAKWTGVTFSNGIAGEFLAPFVVPRFGEEVPAYVDRIHQWNGATAALPLPDYLDGGEYIMIGNDNRDNTSLQLDVTVSAAALVYLLVDNRLGDADAATPPDFSAGNMGWLVDNGWTPAANGLNRTGDAKLPDEVGVDEGGDGVGAGGGINNWCSVYVKKVAAGTFSLFQPDNAGNNMYGVVITPQFALPTVSLTSPSADATFPNLPATVTLTASASVTSGQISKVEFFYGSTIKIGEATSAPYTVAWNNPNPGRYTLVAKATENVNNRSATSKSIQIVVGKLTSVNFQAATATTPTGYIGDTGEIYGDRGNGFSYGWDVDNTANARERNSVNSQDKRYDTFNHLQKALPAGRVWEIQVPNGRYSVFAVSGDPDNQDSVFDLQVEGITIVSGTPTATARFVEGSGLVTVSDGRLTVSNGPLASNNKVAFIEFAQLPAAAVKPSLAQPKLSGNTLTITWTGGGKLQETSDLTGPWTDVAGNPNGTASVPTSTPHKFYRVLAP